MITNFTLPDHTGRLRSLSDWAGQWVLLYFYPQDDTPGCTTEACNLRDNLPKFKNFKAAVIGISTDSVASHAKFVEKYGLPFTLLADEQKEVVKQFNVQGLLGTKRVSFLIDPQGEIVKKYDSVNPDIHATEVLADLAKLQ